MTEHHASCSGGSFRAVPVGAFADPSFPPPQVSVYGVRRHPWVSVRDGATHWD